MARRDPWVFIGLFAFFALLVVALFGERIAPYEPIYFVVEHGRDPRPYEPGLVFPLGSDLLGRDLLSLVLAGARATLTIVLLAGLARVLAGVLVVALGSLWRPARLLTETVAELVAAVPATLVALVLVKAFVKTDASVLVLIGALLVMGWAGPYRVIRAEIDRLNVAPFTVGARVIGVTRSRLFWRHHLPHLVPVLAMNLSQQVVASIVLVAELGVLGVLVGAVRSINVEESLSIVRTGEPMAALVPDMPEWGAMLASSRTIEALWATRWLIFVPGAAFALTAIAVAAIGFALAHRYARRDLLKDLRGAAAVALVAVTLFVASGLVPERYVDARDWSAAARSELRPAPDIASAFEDAGLRTFSAVREVATVVRSGPATVTIGQQSIAELYPRPSDPPPNTIHARSVVSAATGGGVVQAPLVFAARGFVPSEHGLPPAYFRRQFSPGGVRRQVEPDLGPLTTAYPDDYAGIDVRGKVVLLVRFMGVAVDATDFAKGPAEQVSITGAIKRGAAAVLFVDQFVGSYAETTLPRGRTPSPYLGWESEFPPTETSGVPVIVLDPVAAQRLVAPLGVELSPLLGYDPPGMTWERSLARDLGITARVEVPLRREIVAVPSLVAEVPDIPDEVGRVVVWATRDLEAKAIEPARADVLGALARFAVTRQAPFIFVDFNPNADTSGVRDALKDRRVALVVILRNIDGGGALRFETANGDLIPAFDLYAQKAGARFEVTRRTARIDLTNTPLPEIKTVTLGAAPGLGDARSDAAAVIGYLAGRLALGAPELLR